MTISTSIMAQAEYRQAQKALSRWDNEGGACPEQTEVVAPELTSVERAGYTQHPLTTKAEVHVTDIVNRAEHFRSV